MLAARNPVIFRKEKTTINSNLFFFLPAVMFSSRPPWQAGYLPSKSNVCRLFVQMNTVAYLSVPGLVMSRSCGQSPARDGPDNFQAAFPGRVDHGAERNDDGHCQELHSLDDDDDDEFLRVCCQNLPGSIRLYFGSRNVFYSPTIHKKKTSPFASTVKWAQRNTDESSSSTSSIIIWHCTKSIR